MFGLFLGAHEFIGGTLIFWGIAGIWVQASMLETVQSKAYHNIGLVVLIGVANVVVMSEFAVAIILALLAMSLFGMQWWHNRELKRRGGHWAVFEAAHVKRPAG